MLKWLDDKYYQFLEFLFGREFDFRDLLQERNFSNEEIKEYDEILRIQYKIGAVAGMIALVILILSLIALLYIKLNFLS